MSYVKPKHVASVYRNKDFIMIETSSGYTAFVRDPDGPVHILDTNSDDETLGRCLVNALTNSRFITPQQREEYPLFFDFRLVGEQYKKKVEALLARYGYKTKQSLFKTMILCNARVVDGVLSLGPTRHDKLEAWEGLGDDEKVVPPFDSSEVEIGAALRVAMDRCIP
ncbi:contact-dependent growth inhibition system immunity protein [Burkholderia contaminans]|uniref:contact-dependent growth inhibition system immunity protein n=1 Tax=Burkholderia contaminans TaxID=488447 RepID=UPI001CF2D859|nr:contact-dependent growth inhibition system immunity protein [Burkholderia contaminans]MCA8150843.1 CdiI family contact-dependent growth inhibition immunity protein [Burkholderia contaminans]